ncbi:thiol:disulfide interchange protein DsbG [Alloalcanivorax xenomutans]|jgi:thiol:disulfide interchange protein DsbG|uniref:Thiol:disulfide interchange protein DsbG n=1 Tax=Alloalcanivorax xenomutans TaxID=1094342 RepID=A0A9Q3W3B4_9GAMM|nr:thiol:disulfide interchange protein DsbG [Alloalcanivorax xenomutans]MCE7507338.1 thiol:disulfide interchange protein DsbG [Alloalcanivorax xenomutans]MCE7522869.1 thiol:disulfide interchange protein DsbG [Alloalcanivorax xenomutans]WOA31538.1 thiol:disulfide interchange protein DsbG [Alloalcanivorax xenomutans]WOD28526.1 thiol:disulfide interchange protein DsbG [Alloalcanivorax xenomutans]|tara:strand:- start:652 stop:1242 length:591 start_codon:yes stop_codon:yes gene_type:complete
MLRSLSLPLLLMAALFIVPLAHADDQEDQAAVQKRVFEMLEQSHWVAEGADDPERVVYMFTDMECPYCASQWQMMRPFLQNADNDVQVRHIIVALIKPTSLGKGAAVLDAKDPQAALDKAQGDFNQGGIEPLRDIPAEVENALQANTILMMQLGLRGTPATLFLDPNGRLQAAPGLMNEEVLASYVFQTRPAPKAP